MNKSHPWERQWRDYYDILQVSPKAESEVIAAVYRKLAAKYHPDHHDTGDLEQMKLINEARDVLCDSTARPHYDVAWQMRQAHFSSATAEDVDRAKARERQAQAEADRARHEAQKAREQAERMRRDLEEVLHQQGSRPAEPKLSEDPQSASKLGWLNLITDVAKAAIQAYVSGGEVPESQVQLNGSWRGADGALYHINQQANQVAIQGINPLGMLIVSGSGRLIGHELQLQYGLADGTGGRAIAEVSPDGRQIRGIARNLVTGMNFPILLYR